MRPRDPDAMPYASRREHTPEPVPRSAVISCLAALFLMVFLLVKPNFYSGPPRPPSDALTRDPLPWCPLLLSLLSIGLSWPVFVRRRWWTVSCFVILALSFACLVMA